MLVRIPEYGILWAFSEESYNGAREIFLLLLLQFSYFLQNIVMCICMYVCVCYVMAIRGQKCQIGKKLKLN